jgi:hypothetical protein
MGWTHIRMGRLMDQLIIPSTFDAYMSGAQEKQAEADRKRKKRFGELIGKMGTAQDREPLLQEAASIDLEGAMKARDFYSQQADKEKTAKAEQDKRDAVLSLRKVQAIRSAPDSIKVQFYKQSAPDHYGQAVQMLGRDPTPQEINSFIDQNSAELYARAGEQLPKPDVVSAEKAAELQSKERIAKMNAQSRKEYGVAGLTPEQNAALYGENGAVTTGKLDPYKINSRTARIYADAYIANPNTNMNALGSNASLMRNQSFMLKSFNLEALPDIMNSMVDAGKKIGFSDNRTIGKMQGWVKGEFNDPDYTEYMVQRNDALMNIASVMRGVGMSDQAHRAEMEVSSPTMSPAALDAWLRGQMKNLQPRLNQFRSVTGGSQVNSIGKPSTESSPKAGQRFQHSSGATVEIIE